MDSTGLPQPKQTHQSTFLNTAGHDHTIQVSFIGQVSKTRREMQAFQLSGYFTYPVWQRSAGGQRGPDNRGCTVLRNPNQQNTPRYSMCIKLPYSWKYWRELNLVVKPKIAISRMLADLYLAVRYGIAICIYASRKFWWILIWRL